jgi:hypothetical protein
MQTPSFQRQTFRTYQLRDLKNGLYQIHETEGKAYEGNLQQILAIALLWKLDENDVVEALMQMTDHGHDYAEFGTVGRLIFTAVDHFKVAA